MNSSHRIILHYNKPSYTCHIFPAIHLQPGVQYEIALVSFAYIDKFSAAAGATDTNNHLPPTPPPSPPLTSHNQPTNPSSSRPNTFGLPSLPPATPSPAFNGGAPTSTTTSTTTTSTTTSTTTPTTTSTTPTTTGGKVDTSGTSPSLPKAQALTLGPIKSITETSTIKEKKVEYSTDGGGGSKSSVNDDAKNKKQPTQPSLPLPQPPSKIDINQLCKGKQMKTNPDGSVSCASESKTQHEETTEEYVEEEDGKRRKKRDIGTQSETETSAAATIEEEEEEIINHLTESKRQKRQANSNNSQKIPPAAVAVIKTINIKCDLISPHSYKNGIHTRILHSFVTTITNSGALKREEPKNLIYLPLTSNSEKTEREKIISEINIRIDDFDKNLINFDSNFYTVVLHLREIYWN
jgi:hypothetical protein